MIGNFRPEAVAEHLGLDMERHLPQLILALGKPDEEIYLTELKPGEPSAYYRDEENRHFVPKRLTVDLII
jgi:nitroreductase